MRESKDEADEAFKHETTVGAKDEIGRDQSEQATSRSSWRCGYNKG